MKLTPEQQHALRIAVAEIDGYSAISHATDHRGRPMAPKRMWQSPRWGYLLEDWQLPNYPADLNSVHEVERVLTREQCTQFHDILMDIKSPRSEMRSESEKWSWHATALQRCIALVMTLAPAKWEAIKAMGGKEEA